ncbi:Polysaccharide deacetylase [Cellulophaga lytica]|nr:Polysaccharide deacetylase [Cellulophaga lytica]
MFMFKIRFFFIINFAFFLMINSSCSKDIDEIIDTVVVQENDSVPDVVPKNAKDSLGIISYIELPPESTNGFGVEDLDVEIATWFGFKRSSVTHTWDDSNYNQINIAIPLYDSFNLKTTLFSLPNKIKYWEPYKKAYDNGHEVASHSLNHLNFEKITSSQIENELKESKNEINEKMQTVNCLTFAYPYCGSEAYGLTEKYYIAARSCKNSIQSNKPSDYYDLGGVLCGETTQYFLGEQLNDLAQKSIDSNGWAIYLFHNIDIEGGFSVNSQELKKHLTYLNQNIDIYWVATFLDVVKYIKEREAVSIKVKNQTSNLIEISITDNLDDSIYNHPITVKKKIPSETIDSSLVVKQSNVGLDYGIAKLGDSKFVIFNVIPDTGTVSISF